MAGVMALEWFGTTCVLLGRIEHELLLFAAVWFALGALDEIAVDGLWLWLRLTGRVRTGRVDRQATAPLRGVAAVLVPAWREADVIGTTIRHALSVWPQADLRLYVGCYRNDPATLAALIGIGGDPRLRIVIHNREGPTTKADCLNRLYAAVVEDEQRGGYRARAIILHDAEDMVHPAGLALLDQGLDTADFVQLPVRAEPQPQSPWIGGHYCDEFAESHGKAMVVRDWLGAGLPAAGVGCAFSRAAIEAIAEQRGGRDPFAAECLTEDYEFGLLIREVGRHGRFVRMRDADGALVATREFFPARLVPAVRQKTRWLHGIAFQGWERLGWKARPAELWMRLRDRRGPMTAIVLAAAYLLLPIALVLVLAQWAGVYAPPPVSPVLHGLLQVNFAALLWRLAARVAFTTREFGWREGLRAIPRLPVANVIAIMAGRRALSAYIATLRFGRPAQWDHTVHSRHPALVAAAAPA